MSKEGKDILDKMQTLSTKTLISALALVFAVGGYMTKLTSDISALEKRFSEVFAAHESRDAEVYKAIHQKIDNIQSQTNRTDRILEDISKRLDEIYKLMMSKHN